MNIKGLSNNSKMELRYFIYHGLNNDIDKLINGEDTVITKEIVKEMLDWYKDNIIIGYNSLEKKFDKVR